MARVLNAMDEKNLRAKDLFHILDRDRSSTVDRPELETAFAQLGVQLGEDSLEDLLFTLDSDGDGKVHICEFVQQLRHAKNVAAGRASETVMSRREDLFPLKGRRQMAQLVMTGSRQTMDIERNVDYCPAPEPAPDPGSEEVMVDSVRLGSAAERAARLPLALARLQQDMAELSTEGQRLRRQLRAAVKDHEASSLTTVFDLHCKREHHGYPALMVQSQIDVMRKQHTIL